MTNTPYPPSTTSSASALSTPQLLQEAERQVVKWRRWRRYTIGFFGLLALSPLLIFMFWHPSTMTPLSAHLMVDPLFFGALGLLVSYLMRPTRRNPLNYLWDAQDVEAIGPLAESMQMALPEISMKAIPALLRLLPRVNEQNAPHLTSFQRTCLHKILGSGTQDSDGAPTPVSVITDGIGVSSVFNVFKTVRTLANAQSGYVNPQLAEAIFYAYIFMGNSDDLRVVQRLARPAANSLTQTVGAANMQKAAQDVLPLLAERVKQSDVRDVSLRPATAPSDTSTLLHPAQGVPSQPIGELLRADTRSQAEVTQNADIPHPSYTNQEANIQQTTRS